MASYNRRNLTNPAYLCQRREFFESSRSENLSVDNTPGKRGFPQVLPHCQERGIQ